MKIAVVTLFPAMLDALRAGGVTARAQARRAQGLRSVHLGRWALMSGWAAAPVHREPV